jgi:NADH-quinone oxidoreductase subunit L
MFVGWEGVGLASYLLIGFWFTNEKTTPSRASKAFIVNRIGDFGLILGMAILAWKGGSYRFDTLHEHVAANGTFMQALSMKTGLGPFNSPTPCPWCTATPRWSGSSRRSTSPGAGSRPSLLFVGACGKSAQIPLYVWLPDAMAGPTPVSALIHAATMVTAGIYLLPPVVPVRVLATVMAIVAWWARPRRSSRRPSR